LVIVMTRRALLTMLGSTLAGCFGCTSKSVFTDYECFLCKGAGTMRCTGCFGKGSTYSFESGTSSGRSRICATCGGSGQMKCQTCSGKGKLSNNPFKG